jgi:beta-N-acetylhexosaminidase
LRGIGVNVDLAPVVDVEGIGGSFLGTRSFGSDATTVADRACAFASGLSEGGVAYTLKHFPGLGTASATTDVGPVTVDTEGRRIRANYAPYRECGHGANGLVMVSSAAYPRLTGFDGPALFDPAIYRNELGRARVTLPTISDDLDAPAIAGLHDPARRALEAGVDLLLYAQTERSSAVAYDALFEDLRNGSFAYRRVLNAAAAVARLKRMLARR